MALADSGRYSGMADGETMLNESGASYGRCADTTIFAEAPLRAQLIVTIVYWRLRAVREAYTLGCDGLSMVYGAR